MSDFIREVDEEYRRERVANFLKRYQVQLVILVVLILAGAGAWRWWVDHRVAQAEEADVRYREADLEARSGQPAQAQAGYGRLEREGPAGYALLSGLRNAEAQSVRDPEGAAQVLDKIASDDTKGTPALRDLARFRGALLRVDRQDPAAFDNQYGRFALDSFAFHNGMRELLALAAMRRNDLAAAAKYLDDILADPVAPPALRNRAQAFRELVNAGPATTIAAAPGPATVTPLVPDAAQFAPIAPPGGVPPSDMPPSDAPPSAAPPSAPDAAASASQPAAPEPAAPASSPPAPSPPASLAPIPIAPAPVAPNATSSAPAVPSGGPPPAATPNATAPGIPVPTLAPATTPLATTPPAAPAK